MTAIRNIHGPGGARVKRVYGPSGQLLWAGGSDLRARTLPGGWSVTRASSGWNWASGVLVSAGTNVARFADDPRGNAGLGLMLEAAATNLIGAGDYRDLSGWTRPNATVAAVAGRDGTSNASRVTATADNATVTLTVTASLGEHTFSAWVRNASGDHSIAIGMDGTGSYDITAMLMNGWARVQMNVASANPTLTFVIAKSGDAIDVDFCQLEIGVGATSEITGGATRAAETLNLPLYGAGVTFADLIAVYPVLELDRRCILARVHDHATKPIFTFAACDSPLGGFVTLPELSVEYP